MLATFASENQNEYIKNEEKSLFFSNKAGYTATPVACRWAGAIIEVSGTFGQEQ